MKVFISWSGERSKLIGAGIRDWLPSVLPGVTPYFTERDLPMGDQWVPKLIDELQDAQIGILVITSERIDSKWLHFEAGALAQQLGFQGLCPLLCGVKLESGPHSLFQAAVFNEASVFRVLQTINSKMTSKGLSALTDAELEERFRVEWPRLEPIQRIFDPFGTFFGTSATEKDVRLVFGTRKSRESRRRGDVETQFDYPLRTHLDFPKGEVPFPKAVTAWLAHDDILVATMLSRLFMQECNRALEVSLDSALGDGEWGAGPTIAVGLGFNRHTRTLLSQSGLSGNVQVQWIMKPFLSDGIFFNEKIVTRKERHDFAIIARIVLAHGHVHFICAGRTAPGTAAAGRFLAENWRTMADEYGSKSTNASLAVLIQHPVSFEAVCTCNSSELRIVDHAFSESADN